MNANLRESFWGFPRLHWCPLAFIRHRESRTAPTGSRDGSNSVCSVYSVVLDFGCTLIRSVEIL